MHVIIVNEKKVMNLKERGKRHMGGLEGGKEIVTKLQSKKLKKVSEY